MIVLRQHLGDALRRQRTRQGRTLRESVGAQTNVAGGTRAPAVGQNRNAVIANVMAAEDIRIHHRAGRARQT